MLRKIVLPRIHAGQAKWYNRDERFIVVAAGTKAGKTYGAVLWLWRQAWQQPNTVCWWVAPVYHQAKIAFRLMRRLLSRTKDGDGKHLRFEASYGRLEIELPNGTLIQFKSAKDADNLYGESVHAAVFDEASRGTEEAWVALRSTLTGGLVQTGGGRCLLIANAKGKKNFFYRLFLHGGDPGYPEFYSCRQPTSANPWILQSELEQARRVLPERVFRELYLAEFLDEAAGVFSGWSECVVGSAELPQADHWYVVGADFGRRQDWSVFTVIDGITRHVVHMHRTQQPWTSQVQTLVGLAERYNNAVIWADSTGVGDPIVEELEGKGAWVEPIWITPRFKNDMVLRLQGEIEHQGFTIPEDEEYTVLHNELDVFGYEVTKAGNVRYSAPSGFHDDCVISLGLGIHGLAETRPPEPIIIKGTGRELARAA